jgi:DNA-directed RNA polymerase specialized sigma24 family protein
MEASNVRGTWLDGSSMADHHDPWATWFERHAASLILLARQYVPDQAEAEDVVQEAFVRFWKARHRVSDPAAFINASVRGGRSTGAGRELGGGGARR